MKVYRFLCITVCFALLAAVQTAAAQHCHVGGYGGGGYGGGGYGGGGYGGGGYGGGGYGGGGYGGGGYGGGGYGGYGHLVAYPYVASHSANYDPLHCAPGSHQTAYGSGNGQYQKSYTNTPTRQFYSGWQYDAARSCYCCYYQYLPATNSAAYKFHEVVYYGPHDMNHYYFFNPYKRKYWGRAPVHNGGVARYSRLAPEQMREGLKEIPDSSFPTPGAMPNIPESTDNVAMIMPHGGGTLTPDKLVEIQGNWTLLQQDSQGRHHKTDMSIKPDGTATMTKTIQGELPKSMLCRYSFEDSTLLMANNDYGQVKMQVASANSTRLELVTQGQSLPFQRP